MTDNHIAVLPLAQIPGLYVPVMSLPESLRQGFGVDTTDKTEKV
jgi:hypothetical protein